MVKEANAVRAIPVSAEHVVGKTFPSLAGVVGALAGNPCVPRSTRSGCYFSHGPRDLQSANCAHRAGAFVSWLAAEEIFRIPGKFFLTQEEEEPGEGGTSDERHRKQSVRSRNRSEFFHYWLVISLRKQSKRRVGKAPFGASHVSK